MRSNRKKARCKILIISIAAFIASYPVAGGAKGGMQIRQALDTVISQDKYNYKDAGLINSEDKNSLLEKIRIFLKDLMDQISETLKISSYVSLVLYATITVAVIYFLIKALRRIDLGRASPAGIRVSEEKQNLDFRKELAQAERLISKGRAREAVSFIVNALWLYYNYTGVMAYRKSSTNREYLRMAENNINYNSVRRIVLDSEKTVYSGAEVDEKQAVEILAQVNGIIAG
jgi:hypothetical protein